MKNDLKIAVCIPTFNRAQYLPEAIESLLSQKASQFDVHIFDNASTDNSKEVVESLYSGRVIWHEGGTNIGYVGNVNRCLALADSYDWIGILHSDDKHLGESVNVILRYARLYPNAGIIFSNYSDRDTDKKSTQKSDSVGKVFVAGDEAVLRCQTQIPCSSTFYSSKAILSEGLYSEAFPYTADEEYAARIGRHYDIVQTSEALAYYRRHGGHTMIKTWAEADFIKSFEDMRILMNSYLSPRYRRSQKHVETKIALSLLNQCSGLLAHGHINIVKKFYYHALKKAPLHLFAPKRFVRLALHFTPLLGPLLCRRLSKNAGFRQ